LSKLLSEFPELSPLFELLIDQIQLFLSGNCTGDALATNGLGDQPASMTLMFGLRTRTVRFAASAVPMDERAQS
jgi:hypothetical protein